MPSNPPSNPASTPWYRRARRWGQTNLVEIDPERYDTDWWRGYWRRTKVQGVIINAGGIVAYYPTRFGLHHRALTLRDGDLYGDVVAAARAEGLTVIARMDSNRVAEDFYRVHPDWVCVDRDGRPYRVEDKYITCINSPYYWEYLPEVLREIIERSSPDGFADNSWAGIPRDKICYCSHCARLFRERTGLELPQRHDWADEPYRRWIAWSYQRRTELWDFNNQVTTQAGGPDCRWMGMISGDALNNSKRFIDVREILRRSEIVMLDHQHRSLTEGFEQNTEAGKRLHELLGWDKLIPESTPQYQLGVPAFRVAAMPKAEVRLWASAGFAGGIQPWWHHIGSCHDDRRQYTTAEPIFTWHEANEDVLFDRTPIADVGIVWSQHNNDFYGQDKPAERAWAPYRGVVKALNEAGLGYLPVHADDLAEAAGRFRVLVLPDLAAMSDEQIRTVQSFAEAGGSVVVTGESSRYTETGDLRPDFGLADLLGVHAASGAHGDHGVADPNIETYQRHTYLRLTPEFRSEVDGPRDPQAPVADGDRHPVLTGFEETDVLPFGGYLPVVDLDADADVLATLVPPFPIFPPETSWMRRPRTDIPAIVVGEQGPSRRVWLLADLDRSFARDEQVDHGVLIANAVRWAIGDQPAVEVEADGLVAASLYRQPGRLVLHLTNTVRTSAVPGRQGTIVPVGPVTVRLRTDGAAPAKAELRVAGATLPVSLEHDQLVVRIDRIAEHEVLVLPID